MKRCNNCGWFNLDSAVRCEKCEEESFEPVVESAQEPEVSSTDIVEEPAKPQAEPEPKNDVAANDNTPQPEVTTSTIEEPANTASQKRASFANATVAYNSKGKTFEPRETQRTGNHKNLAATVMDASIMMQASEVTNCPKCRYPLSGHNEYCPNCGTTIRKPESLKKTQRTADITKIVDNESEVKPRVTVPIEEDQNATVAPNNNLKSTVRDFSGMSANSLSKAPSATNLKATVRDVPSVLKSDNPNSYKLIPVDGIGEAIIELNLGEEVVIAGKRYKFQK